MDNRNFILNDKREAVQVPLLEWAAWFESTDRHVALDHVALRFSWFQKKTIALLNPILKLFGYSFEESACVSTVFLGIDHNFGDGAPLLFETMIFGGKHNEYQRRYATWTEAEAGHKHAVSIAGDVW